MSGTGWDELFSALDDDDTTLDNEWGRKFSLDVGTTFVGWWRGQDIYTSRDDDRRTPVYLLRDRDGADVFVFGGRSQVTMFDMTKMVNKHVS